MQISRMFPEQLSWRHAVNIPLLPADVEQHWCPRVTLNRSFRWSLLYYTTDILETLFPRMCESCQGGVSFMGKAGSKQCVSNENTRCKELPFAALGYVCVVVLLRAGSRSQHCFPLPNLCTPMAASQRAAFPWKGVDLPLLSIRRGMQSFWFQQTKYPLVSEEFRFSTPLSFVFNFSPVKAFSCRIKAEIIN